MTALKAVDLLVNTTRILLRIKTCFLGDGWWTTRFLIVSAGLSFFLTTTAIFIADPYWFQDTLHSVPVVMVRKLLGSYLLNYALNVASLLVTLKILALMLLAPRIWHPVLLLLDAGVAFVLAILCWVAAASIDFPNISPITLQPLYFDVGKLGRHITLYVGYAHYSGLIETDTIRMLSEASGGWISQIKIFGTRLANWNVANLNLLPTLMFLGSLICLALSHLLFNTLRYFNVCDETRTQETS